MLGGYAFARLKLALLHAHVLPPMAKHQLQLAARSHPLTASSACCRTSVPHAVMLHAQLVLSRSESEAADVLVTVSPEDTEVFPPEPEVAPPEAAFHVSTWARLRSSPHGTFILFVFGSCAFVATTAFITGVALHIH
eukprot:1332766-Rhodomonas_salina.2